MATVADKSGNTPYIDNSLVIVQRNNAGTPVSSVTPAYVGEIVLDSTNGIMYRAIGTANTAWEVVTRP